VAWSSFDSTNAGKSLKLRTIGRRADECLIAVECIAPAIQRDISRVHPGAMVILADECLGSAASDGLTRHLVTLDLRLDWFAPAQEQIGIYCHARTVAMQGRTVYVTSDLTQGESGPLVARAFGQFLTGASPGGFTNKKPGSQIIPEDLGWPCFEAFLDLQKQGPVYVLDPGKHRIGSLFLPALHGGITAAALQQAMLEEVEAWRPGESVSPLSSTTQFLNAGAALEPLLVETSWVRQGRSVAMIAATARQTRHNDAVAVSQATFIINPPTAAYA
jgi:acyl-coenzyme A thioesterase PaaI-like protein